MNYYLQRHLPDQKEEGEIYPLTGDVIIGRDKGATIYVDDPACSRFHAFLRLTPQGVILVDLGSSNGTYVNKKRAAQCALSPQDRLQIGKTLFLFQEKQDALETSPDRARVEKAREAFSVRKDLKTRITTTFKPPSEMPPSRDPEGLEGSSPDAVNLLSFSNRLVHLNVSQLPETLLPFLGETLLGLHRAALLQFFESRESWDLIRLWGSPGAPSTLSLSDDLLRELRSKQSLLVYEEPPWTCILVPFFHQEHLLGTLYVEGQKEKLFSSVSVLQSLTTLANFLSPVFRDFLSLQEKGEGRPLSEEDGISEHLLGRSPAFVETLEMARKVAESSAPVLMLGETGTGKECLARYLHALSERKHQPFVAMNCASLVESLLEAELFGYEKGAYTGAYRTQKGKLELADGGTLFLDEIAELTLPLQAKILRVIEEKKFYPLGSNKLSNVNVRFVGATNEDLEKAVEAGKFRQDLFFRLNVVILKLPPLRQRREDIGLLSYHFLNHFADEMKKNVRKISSEVLSIFQRYAWPGNIRELKNVLERALLLGGKEEITADVLPGNLLQQSVEATAFVASSLNLREMEKECIVRALKASGGKKGEAAKLLGISWPTLNKKCEEYGIES